MDEESKKNAPPIPEIESELHDLGKPIGERILDLAFYREKGSAAACSGGKGRSKSLKCFCLLKTRSGSSYLASQLTMWSKVKRI